MMKKIAIFGYNPLSFEVLSRLNPSVYDILIVERNQSLAEQAQQKGYNACSIDFRCTEGLKSIGIGHDIDIIFCFLSEDSANVFLILSARELDKKLNIIAIVDSPQATEKLIAAGANKVIDPYQICGQKIHQLIKTPAITHIIDHVVFGRHDLHIAEVTIPDGSPLEDTLSDDLIANNPYHLVFIGIVDKELGNEIHFAIEGKNHKLNAGDIIIVLGPSREIRAFKKHILA